MRTFFVSLMLAVALLPMTPRAPLLAESPSPCSAALLLAVTSPGSVSVDGNRYSTQGEVLSGFIDLSDCPIVAAPQGLVTIVANSETRRDLQTGLISGNLRGNFVIQTQAGTLTGSIRGRIGGNLFQGVTDSGTWKVEGGTLADDLKGEGKWNLLLRPVLDQNGNLLTYAGPGQLEGKLKVED